MLDTVWRFRSTLRGGCTPARNGIDQNTRNEGLPRIPRPPGARGMTSCPRPKPEPLRPGSGEVVQSRISHRRRDVLARLIAMTPPSSARFAGRIARRARYSVNGASFTHDRLAPSFLGNSPSLLPRNQTTSRLVSPIEATAARQPHTRKNKANPPAGPSRETNPSPRTKTPHGPTRFARRVPRTKPIAGSCGFAQTGSLDRTPTGSFPDRSQPREPNSQAKTR